MKILMADKYYFIKGGAERYVFELTEVLEKNGHEVIPFAMQHPDSFDTPYKEFFVDQIEYNLESHAQKWLHSMKIMGRMIYSFHAKRRLSALIEKTRPDIAHLHMIDHQISPSILHTLKQYGIPVIQTVHQYKLVCPNYRLYNMRTHQVCEKCLGGHYYHPIVERCHMDSMLAGLMIAMETRIHQWMKIYENNVDLFHVPSMFMGRKLAEGGIPESKIEHLFYTIQVDAFAPSYTSNDYMLYFGRLAEEKGILTLLQAMRQAPSAKLLLAGDGPQRTALESFAAEHGLQNVEFLGYKGGDDLKSLIARSEFVIVPSEWYDNSPLVIYEAASMGKPVIASRMGGMPELIEDGKTGHLFEAGDVETLAGHIQHLAGNKETLQAMGRQARARAEALFAPEPHYRDMMKKYERLLNQSIES